MFVIQSIPFNYYLFVQIKYFSFNSFRFNGSLKQLNLIFNKRTILCSYKQWLGRFFLFFFHFQAGSWARLKSSRATCNKKILTDISWLKMCFRVTFFFLIYIIFKFFYFVYRIYFKCRFNLNSLIRQNF